MGREPTLGVAAISTWEVAMLVAKKRLTLDRDVLVWLRDALAQPKMMLLPLTPEIAASSARLSMHGDPADRMIVATALAHGSDLVSADRTIRRGGLVTVVW
jgi:PIN domain nuclease of toxin-antitoxin system